MVKHKVYELKKLVSGIRKMHVGNVCIFIDRQCQLRRNPPIRQHQSNTAHNEDISMWCFVHEFRRQKKKEYLFRVCPSFEYSFLLLFLLLSLDVVSMSIFSFITSITWFLLCVPLWHFEKNFLSCENKMYLFYLFCVFFSSSSLNKEMLIRISSDIRKKSILFLSSCLLLLLLLIIFPCSFLSLSFSFAFDETN